MSENKFSSLKQKKEFLELGNVLVSGVKLASATGLGEEVKFAEHIGKLCVKPGGTSLEVGL